MIFGRRGGVGKLLRWGFKPEIHEDADIRPGPRVAIIAAHGTDQTAGRTPDEQRMGRDCRRRQGGPQGAAVAWMLRGAGGIRGKGGGRINGAPTGRPSPGAQAGTGGPVTRM